MSPEQIVGNKEIDARTDIWSLGVVAFEAMTGQRPFEGTTVGAITLAIHSHTPRISALVPGAPVALDDWFSQACARDPKERFQTPREAAQALLQAAGDPAGSVPMLRAPMPSIVSDSSDPSLATASPSSGPTSDGRAATHLSSVFPVPRPSRTRPALVAAAIGALLVLVGAMFVVPRLLAPRETGPTAADNSAPTATSATVVPSASASTTSVAASVPSAAPSAVASGAAAASSPHIAVSGALATARSAVTATTRPTTRPTTTTTTPTKPTKPGRTRDDDDIK